MTKCLTIGLSSFAATIARYAVDDASDGDYRDRTINHEDDWYSKENMTQPFEDNYIPGAPSRDSTWM